MLGRDDDAHAVMRRCGYAEPTPNDPDDAHAVVLDELGWRFGGSSAVLVLEGEPPAGRLEALAGSGPYAVVVVPAAVSAATLVALRRGGLADADTALVAVSQRPHPHLAAWGVAVVAPGATVARRPTAAPATRTLLLGGARSGKSQAGEAILAAEPSVTYVATGASGASGATGGHDPEWRDRVAVHQARRGAHWTTVETDDLVAVLRSARQPLLVDCLSLWLSRALDAAGAWSEDRAARDRAVLVVRERVADLAHVWSRTRCRAVAVSSEVGSGIVPATASGRLFRDELGRLNAAIAAQSDDIGLVVAGRVIAL